MQSSKPTQILALDGIRGIAILAVMVHHFSCVFQGSTSPFDRVLYSIASRDRHGVDLFFVLSGFLITRILIYSRGRENWLQSFYMRRVLRIFPVYFLYLLLIFGMMRQIYPDKFVNTHALPYMVYLSNWQAGTGFADFRLGHIWSLAVEEQFYLVWPILVLLCPPRRLIHAAGAICLLALGLRLAATGHVGMHAIDRMTPFRIDALAAGAVLAAISTSDRGSRLIRRLGLPAAGAALMLAVALRGTAYSYAVQFSVIVVCCGAFVFLGARHNPGWLRHPFLTTAGKYSYGMYVYHVLLSSQIWPWLKACDRVVPLPVLRWVFLPLAGGTAFMAAWLSYRYFESPFLRLKEHFVAGVAAAPEAQRDDVQVRMAPPAAGGALPAC